MTEKERMREGKEKRIDRKIEKRSSMGERIQEEVRCPPPQPVL